MITLGRNQTKILKALETGRYTVEELAQKSGVKIQTVKNTLYEFLDAQVVIKREDKYYSLNPNPPKIKTDGDEDSFWAPVRLKNLARIV